MYFAFIFLAITLGVYILFIWTLQNTLKAVNPLYRSMQPTEVWRLLIPLYNYYFIFIVVDAIADSISNHLAGHGVASEKQRPTHTAGRVFAISIIGYVFINALFPADLTAIVSLISLTSFLVYWVQVAIYKKKVSDAPELTLDAEATVPVPE